jgi:hypothetical protein
MKKIALFSIVILGIVAISCNKETTLPAYTPPVKNNFSITRFAHQKDTINVGDSLIYNASGTITDTTRNLYVILAASYGSVTYTLGTAASPIKINRVIGAANNGVYSWTAAIPAFVTAGVSHNSKVSLTATFSYQLSLSSVQPTVVFTDQGLRPGDKTNLTTVLVK